MSGAVCVLGSFMTDLIVNAPRRPLPGETLVGTDFGIYLGGKGFNQAVAAARSGARTAMIGRLGDDDFGDDFREALDHEGIDRVQVALDVNHGTGVGVPVVEPDGQNSIIIVPRANAAVATTDVALAAGPSAPPTCCCSSSSSRSRPRSRRRGSPPRPAPRSC
jgi:ribokinase